MKKKKMAFIDVTNYSNWPMGGMLEYELTILKELTKKYSVDLWGVSVDGIIPEPIEINDRIYKINVYANVSTKTKFIPNFWKGMFLFFNKNFKKNHYDIIYGHSGSCMTAACLAYGSKSTVFAYHQHGLSYKTNYSLFSYSQKPFYWAAQKLSDLVFLVTDDESAFEYAKEMKNKSKAKFVGIGSPINLDIFNLNNIKERIESSKEKTLKNFIYVGRISPEKNILDMIKALNEYKKMASNDNFKLTIVGDGTDRCLIENEVTKLGLENNVDFIGKVSHDRIYKFLEESDVFLISSNGEGVSIAVLEAFASGLPVVCYRVPGLERQNIDSYTGYVVEKNYIAFAKAMKRIEKSKTEFSYNCLKQAQIFDRREIVNKIENEISSIRKEAK